MTWNDDPRITAALEQHLKKSDFFASAMNAQRAAVADLLADFLNLLVQSEALDGAALLASLEEMDRATRSPSEDSTRRYLVAMIRDRMKQKRPANGS